MAITFLGYNGESRNGMRRNTYGFHREIILLSVYQVLRIENYYSCFQRGLQIWNELSKSTLVKTRIECFYFLKNMTWEFSEIPVVVAITIT